MYKSEQNVSEEALFDSEGLALQNFLDWSTIDYQNPLILNQTEIILENQEDTMDASTKYSLVPSELKPVSPKGPPEREIFSGDLKFEIEISGADTNKTKFMYSHRLNRIYVFMGHGFSVQLNWDAAVQPYPVMFVRATPVFSDQAQAEKRVTKCMQHYHDKKNDESMNESMRGSVLHSTRDVGAQDVFYCGEESPDVWYSVVVRFAAPSTHAYQFTCKNSCSSGINRRAIAILFTLEDHTGKVYGRQSVGARACSCPKRDMKREAEEEAPRADKRHSASATLETPAPHTKKIRLERVENSSDPENNELLPFPQVLIVNRNVINMGLSMMLGVTREMRAVAARTHHPTEQLDASIADLKKYLDKTNEK